MSLLCCVVCVAERVLCFGSQRTALRQLVRSASSGPHALRRRTLIRSFCSSCHVLSASWLLVSLLVRPRARPRPRELVIHSDEGGAGGGVSGVVLADGTLRVHVYEDGEDAIFESTERFEDASTLELGSYIVYRTTVDEAGAEDEVLHHSAMPRLGVHLSKERQRSALFRQPHP